MSDTVSQSHKADASSSQSSLRALPAVGRVVEQIERSGDRRHISRWLVTNAVRQTIDQARNNVAQNGASGVSLGVEDLAEQAESLLAKWLDISLEPVINATGVLLHTGLGRAPLAQRAVDAIGKVAGRCAMVELDGVTGRRGRREQRLAPALCQLTGAQSATVVNNNAAALMLVVSTFARGRSVVVSRGELVEIGGSFRLPQIIEAAGATLREVGTTNRTRQRDYENAIDESVGLILKVHTSNYRIEGFTEEVSIESLIEIGAKRGVPVAHDIGSGLLSRGMLPIELPDEPTVADSVSAGVDVALFSGDKLLGGPQAGVLVGKQEAVRSIMTNPMMRAVRIDKLTIAALAATLEIHLDPSRAAKELPLCAFLSNNDVLQVRTERLLQQIQTIPGVTSTQLCQSNSYVGGGSAPGVEIPGVSIAIALENASEQELADRLRLGTPSVIARLGDRRLHLDLRSVFPDEDEALVEAVRAACAGVADEKRER